MASAAVRALAKVRTPRVTLEQLTGEVADRRRAGAYLHGVLPPLLARMAVSLEDGAPASPRSSAGPAFVPAPAPFQAREVEDEVASPLSEDSRRVAARLAEERALRAREVEDEAAALIFRAREVEDEVAASSDDDATVSPKDVDRLLGRERPEETTRWAAVPETYLRPGISISPLPV